MEELNFNLYTAEETRSVANESRKSTELELTPLALSAHPSMYITYLESEPREPDRHQPTQLTSLYSLFVESSLTSQYIHTTNPAMIIFVKHTNYLHNFKYIYLHICEINECVHTPRETIYSERR